jgi:serine/threonine protein phosphatase 1
MTDRIIAIGDVHGCAKALATLIEAIQPTGSDTLVFLGDYIDRGPDSRGVVEQVIALAERCTVVPFLEVRSGQRVCHGGAG